MVLTKNGCPEGEDEDIVLSIHFWVHKVTVEGQANRFDERYLSVHVQVLRNPIGQWLTNENRVSFMHNALKVFEVNAHESEVKTTQNPIGWWSTNEIQVFRLRVLSKLLECCIPNSGSIHL